MDANRFASRRGPAAPGFDPDCPAPDIGEPVFIAAPPCRGPRRHGLLTRWLGRGHGPERRR